MSLKSATERTYRGSWRAESVTLAAGTKTSKVAGLLMMAGLFAMVIVAASKLVAPATRTLVGIARAPSRMVSLTGRAILRGADSKHSYNECHQNPKNQSHPNNSNNYIQKRAHDVHYHDSHRHSSNEELLVFYTSPVPSNNELSSNKSIGNRTPENYHIDSFHTPPRRGR
jgi:hypothetical protein